MEYLMVYLENDINFIFQNGSPVYKFYKHY